MSTSQNESRNPFGGTADGENLRWLVETDRRRGSIGLHVVTDITLANRFGSTLWLDPAQAQAVARAILAAVEGLS